jgi:phenylacetate-CoA ligase
MNTLLNKFHEKTFGQMVVPFYESQIRKRNTFIYRDEAEANQWLSQEDLITLQWKKLQLLLRHAYDTVPYYKDIFNEYGLTPDNITCADEFARLPILEKSTIQSNQDRMTSSRFTRKSLIRSGTGGSTGESMQFFYDRNSYEKRIATAMRGDKWAGWRLCGPEFYLWGAAVLPTSYISGIKKKLHDSLLNRKTVNSFNMNPKDIPIIVKEYNNQRPTVVIGYANALYEFANFVEAHKLALHKPDGVISSAEILYDFQREKIEKIFGCKVFNRYGCREVMMIAAECNHHDGLHVASDNVYVEIVKDGRLCEQGETGEIILTDLHNYGMPFIRYKVGDIGLINNNLCNCGRGLPLMEITMGRTLDIIRTPSGTLIPGEFFVYIFKDFSEIISWQVVQTHSDILNVKIKTRKDLTLDKESIIKDVVFRIVGPEIGIDWEINNHVEIDQSRKFRPVRSMISNPNNCIMQTNE